MPILGKTTNVVMIQVLLFQMMGICVALTSQKTDFSNNNIPTSRGSVLSYLHIGGTKYRIQSI